MVVKVIASACITSRLSKTRFIRRISGHFCRVDAIQTKHNEANHHIIYCLNCIRHGRTGPNIISYGSRMSAHTWGQVLATTSCNKSRGKVISCELAIFIKKNLVVGTPKHLVSSTGPTNSDSFEFYRNLHMHKSLTLQRKTFQSETNPCDQIEIHQPQDRMRVSSVPL